MTSRKGKVTELDVPLFDNLPAAQGSSRDQPKPPRSVEFGWCPNHKGTRLTGLVRGGRHLYWRTHYVATYGSRRLCTASDAPLCSAPATRIYHGQYPPVCPCGGRGDNHSQAADSTATD